MLLTELASAKEVALMNIQKKNLWDRIKIRLTLYLLLWPTVVAWTCGLGTFAIGLGFSNQETSMPFARSGSAVTAIFIFSTIFSVDHVAKQSEQRANGLYRKLTGSLPLTGASSQSRIETKTAENTVHILRVNIFLSAMGLCMATLVWGFGDLLSDSRFAHVLPLP